MHKYDFEYAEAQTPSGTFTRQQMDWLPFVVGFLFIIAFLGGFINGYAVGTAFNQKSPSQITISVPLPQTPTSQGVDQPDSLPKKAVTAYIPHIKATLSNKEYIVYDALVESFLLFSPQSSFTLSSESTVSMERIIEIAKIARNNPEFFWVNDVTWITWQDNPDSTRTYTIEITYSQDKAAVQEILPQLDTAIATILADTEGLSETNASTFVNNWLAHNVTYAENESQSLSFPNDSIVGPLLYHQGICSGFAKTYTYLMARLGYSSAYCLGYTNNGVYHAWNAIRVKGDILYTDSTFNSSEFFKTRWLNIPGDQFVDHQGEKKYWYEPNY